MEKVHVVRGGGECGKTHVVEGDVAPKPPLPLEILGNIHFSRLFPVQIAMNMLSITNILRAGTSISATFDVGKVKMIIYPAFVNSIQWQIYKFKENSSKREKEREKASLRASLVS